jgi:hypothetical protein
MTAMPANCLSKPDNVIPIFGYCAGGCGRPAVRFERLPNGDRISRCEDQPCCRPAGQTLYTPAYCDPDNEVRGALYEPGLNVKEIAKRMRAWIKRELPGVKCSIRIDRFAGGAAIDLRLLEAPCNVNPLIPPREWEEQQERECRRRPWKENFDPAMVKLMEALVEIHGFWNRDNSDSQVDYFDRGYYGSVTCPNHYSW